MQSDAIMWMVHLKLSVLVQCSVSQISTPLPCSFPGWGRCMYGLHISWVTMGRSGGGVVFMKLLCCSQYPWWFLEKDDSPFLVQLVILTCTANEWGWLNLHFCLSPLGWVLLLPSWPSLSSLWWCLQTPLNLGLILHPTPGQGVQFTASAAVLSKPLDRISSVQFSRSVVSDSLKYHGLQHTRPPCSSPTPGVFSYSCPLSRWCHPTISSSVIPFPSCLQSFPASGSFQMSQFFTSGGQSTGVSASTSTLPKNIQDLFPLGWTGWISLQSQGLSRVFSNTTVQKHQFFSAQLSL